MSITISFVFVNRIELSKIEQISETNKSHAHFSPSHRPRQIKNALCILISICVQSEGKLEAQATRIFSFGELDINQPSDHEQSTIFRCGRYFIGITARNDCDCQSWYVSIYIFD